MVAIVNDVPVYVRRSRIEGPEREKSISRAIEGELIVQCEKPWGPDTGTPMLRVEIERKIARDYRSRKDFEAALKKSWTDFLARLKADATIKMLPPGGQGVGK